ncbi:MAG: hypothetical protein WAK44_03760, partial [Trebonia sp.]|uniref:hypothetical protein n=1 Tax=Trebonia sp. TaxID=2767075 RepID=UPI003BB02F36
MTYDGLSHGRRSRDFLPRRLAVRFWERGGSERERIGALSVHASGFLASADIPYMGTCFHASSVVVLGVAGSSPVAHPLKVQV